jgi:hypothetical protein
MSFIWSYKSYGHHELVFFIPLRFYDVLYVTPLDIKADITSSHLLSMDKGNQGELFEIAVVEEMMNQ